MYYRTISGISLMRLTNHEQKDLPVGILPNRIWIKTMCNSQFELVKNHVFILRELGFLCKNSNKPGAIYY
jgi:hypothetical protein